MSIGGAANERGKEEGRVRGEGEKRSCSGGGGISVQHMKWKKGTDGGAEKGIGVLAFSTMRAHIEKSILGTV